MVSLPYDILMIIFSYLDRYTLSSCYQVCQSWKLVADARYHNWVYFNSIHNQATYQTIDLNDENAIDHLKKCLQNVASLSTLSKLMNPTYQDQLNFILSISPDIKYSLQDDDISELFYLFDQSIIEETYQPPELFTGLKVWRPEINPVVMSHRQTSFWENHVKYFCYDHINEKNSHLLVDFLCKKRNNLDLWYRKKSPNRSELLYFINLIDLTSWYYNLYPERIKNDLCYHPEEFSWMKFKLHFMTSYDIYIWNSLSKEVKKIIIELINQKSENYYRVFRSYFKTNRSSGKLFNLLRIYPNFRKYILKNHSQWLFNSFQEPFAGKLIEFLGQLEPELMRSITCQSLNLKKYYYQVVKKEDHKAKLDKVLRRLFNTQNQ